MSPPDADTTLDYHRSRIEAFASDHLTSYVQKLKNASSSRRPASKEINDAVWGTLKLTALEVLILDSPLLQRLRSIRQLGVAHLVYPTAIHTRFEHSLGVVYQVDRLISAFNSNLPVGDDPTPSPITSEYRQILRLAALCHDIGHGVMSHVSENALAYHECVETLLLEFEQLESVRRTLGELNSYLIVGSPAFKELLQQAQECSNAHIELSDPHKIMQDAIVSKRFDSSIPWLQEVISGPFDADKLDYMARDARMSGVPEVTDVDRLTSKVRAITASPDALPSHLRSTVPDRDFITITGVARSGNRTLDELTLGRTLLFDKLYRHHKVRAAEALITAMFLQFAKLIDTRDIAYMAITIKDDDLQYLTRERLLLLLNLTAPLDENAVDVIQDLADRLRERRLLVRALAFSRKMPSDPFESIAEHVDGIKRLLLTLEDPQERLAIATDIASASREGLEATGKSDTLEDFPNRDLTSYVWIDPPRSVPNPGVTANALLITDDRKVVSFNTEAPETSMWAMAYHQTRDVGYVFSAPEVAPYVALAAERLFRVRYKVRVPAQMMVFSAGAREELDTVRRSLAATNFYVGCPRDLLPTPARLTMADVPGSLDVVCRRLHAYQGPSIAHTELGRGGVSPEQVRSFLTQFQHDGLVEAAMRALQNILFVGRREVVTALKELLNQHPEFHSASLVQLGSLKDSSAQNVYFALDVAKEFPGLVVLDLPAALARGAPLIFVDDFVGSGAQASAIIDAWMGDTAASEGLGEARQSLPSELKEMLGRAVVGFVFAAGMTDGASEVKTRCAAHGMDILVHVGIADTRVPSLYSVEYADDAQKSSFITRCEEVGLELRKANGDSRAEERKLGYGNQALLVVFSYNTPTQTVTCLWDRGTVDGAPWDALVPRRKKK